MNARQYTILLKFILNVIFLTVYFFYLFSCFVSRCFFFVVVVAFTTQTSSSSGARTP